MAVVLPTERASLRTLFRNAAIAPDLIFPISFRFSQWKQLDYSAQIAETPRELAILLEPLSDAGVTSFHASTRRFWEPGVRRQ